MIFQKRNENFLSNMLMFVFCSRIEVTDFEANPDLEVVDITANVTLLMYGTNALALLLRVQETALEWEPRQKILE